MELSQTYAVLGSSVDDQRQNMAMSTDDPIFAPPDSPCHAWDFSSPTDFINPSDDGVTAAFRARPLRTGLIRGKESYSSGTHVFEIHWPEEGRDEHAAVGVTTALQQRSSEGQTDLLGSSSESWGLNLHCGTLLHDGRMVRQYDGGNLFPHTFFIHLDADAGTVSFMANGRNFGVAFSDLPHTSVRPLFVAASTTNQYECAIRMRYLGDGDAVVPVEIINQSPLSYRSQCTPDYTFHPRCGRNIEIVDAGTTAEKVNEEMFNNAVALTSQPLKVDHPFQVRLVSKTRRDWKGSIRIGFTTLSPQTMCFPSDIKECSEGLTYVWCGRQLFKNGNLVSGVLDFDLTSCQVGDTVGILLTGDGSVLFSHNGLYLGTCLVAFRPPSQVYGVVDFSGPVKSVSITDDALVTPVVCRYTGSSTTTASGNAIEDCMEAAVDRLMRRKASTGSLEEQFRDIEYLMRPLAGQTPPEVQRRFGALLAGRGVAGALADLLRVLHKGDVKSKVTLRGLDLVSRFCCEYTSVSPEMCRSIEESPLLGLLKEDFHEYWSRGELLMKVLQNIKMYDCTPGFHTRSENRPEADSTNGNRRTFPEAETSSPQVVFYHHHHSTNYNINGCSIVQIGNNNIIVPAS